MMRHLILLATLTVAACGSPSKKVDDSANSSAPDQGSDVSDAGDILDMAPDDGNDAGPDADAEVPVDMSADAGAFDAGLDAGPDMAPDVGPDLPPEPLNVVSIIPADAATQVPVSAAITVTFDAQLDTVSIVTLEDAAGTVPVSTAINGAMLVVTPDSDLREFQTTYTLTVSAGVTGEGRVLSDDIVSTFTTRMFVPDQFYAASNEFHGVGFSIGIDAANQCVMMPADDTAPAQRWRAAPRNNGWIIYNSRTVASGRALDGSDGVTPCSMAPLGASPMTSQVWSFQNQSSSFQMQNERFGIAQSLDSTANPASMDTAKPLMQPTASVNRQFWLWRRLQ